MTTAQRGVLNHKWARICGGRLVGLMICGRVRVQHVLDTIVSFTIRSCKMRVKNPCTNSGTPVSWQI